jgi:hypothetical protein
VGVCGEVKDGFTLGPFTQVTIERKIPHMNKVIRNGIIGLQIVTLVGGASVVLAHSPPKSEMPHADQEQHRPMDKDRRHIVTATGTTSRIYTRTGAITVSGAAPVIPAGAGET